MAKGHQINIQDGFLFQNLKDATQMAVDLTTGKHYEGRIKRFDRFAIILETEDEEEILVYKHAIATITEAVSGG
ncbi:MAG: RNA chaperone Hfq [Thermoanaerobaculia bacterium]|nr:RNA chaperone Hfq [Thermoanaerobaculia bacterium]